MQKQADTAVSRSFVTGQPVMVRDLLPSATEKWQRAVIVSRGGPLTYSVRLPDGRARLAHVDHLLADGSARAPVVDSVSPGLPVAEPPPVEPGKLRGSSPSVAERPPVDADPSLSDAERSMCGADRAAGQASEQGQTLRRSARLAEKR